MLGLRCGLGFSLVVPSDGCSLVALLRILMVVAVLSQSIGSRACGQARRLSCPSACHLRPGIERASCFARQILNHWTTRETQGFSFNIGPTGLDRCMMPCGFPGGSGGKEPACQCKRFSERLRFDHWVGKIPWRRAQQPTPVFLPGESHR